MLTQRYNDASKSGTTEIGSFDDLTAAGTPAVNESGLSGNNLARRPSNKKHGEKHREMKRRRIVHRLYNDRVVNLKLCG
jgi:hypothetical protein